MSDNSEANLASTESAPPWIDLWPSGRRVDLKSITAPVLNVFALDDQIIPPDTSRALGAKIGSTDYTEIPLPGGHVGLFVSSKSQGKLSKSIADWLIARDDASAGKT